MRKLVIPAAAALAAATLFLGTPAQAHGGNNAGVFVAGAITGAIVGHVLTAPPAYVSVLPPPPVVVQPYPYPYPYYAPPRVINYYYRPPVVVYRDYGRGWHDHGHWRGDNGHRGRGRD